MPRLPPPRGPAALEGMYGSAAGFDGGTPLYSSITRRLWGALRGLPTALVQFPLQQNYCNETGSETPSCTAVPDRLRSKCPLHFDIGRPRRSIHSAEPAS